MVKGIIKKGNIIIILIQFLTGILFSLFGMYIFEIIWNKLYDMNIINQDLFHGEIYFEIIIAPIFCLLGIVIIDKIFINNNYKIIVGFILGILGGIFGSIIGFLFISQLVYRNILNYSIYEIITTSFCLLGYCIGKREK